MKLLAIPGTLVCPECGAPISGQYDRHAKMIRVFSTIHFQGCESQRLDEVNVRVPESWLVDLDEVSQ